VGCVVAAVEKGGAPRGEGGHALALAGDVEDQLEGTA